MWFTSAELEAYIARVEADANEQVRCTLLETADLFYAERRRLAGDERTRTRWDRPSKSLHSRLRRLVGEIISLPVD
jgi:hypothetical protein